MTVRTSFNVEVKEGFELRKHVVNVTKASK